MKILLELYTAQIDLLAGELGGINAQYRCIQDIKIFQSRPPVKNKEEWKWSHLHFRKSKRPEPVQIGKSDACPNSRSNACTLLIQ